MTARTSTPAPTGKRAQKRPSTQQCGVDFLRHWPSQVIKGWVPYRWQAPLITLDGWRYPWQVASQQSPFPFCAMAAKLPIFGVIEYPKHKSITNLTTFVQQYLTYFSSLTVKQIRPAQINRFKYYHILAPCYNIESPPKSSLKMEPK
jgi:hypothetical protein